MRAPPSCLTAVDSIALLGHLVACSYMMTSQSEVSNSPPACGVLIREPMQPGDL